MLVAEKKITVKEERGRNLFYILKGSSEKKIIKSNKIYLSITILLILIFVNNVFLCTSVTIVYLYDAVNSRSFVDNDSIKLV